MVTSPLMPHAAPANCVENCVKALLAIVKLIVLPSDSVPVQDPSYAGWVDREMSRVAVCPGSTVAGPDPGL